MKKLKQSGAVSVAVILVIVLGIALFGSLGFGVWAFTSRQDYKNNADQKTATAVAAAVKKAQDAKDAEFAEASKEPNKTFKAAETYGSLTFSYPKTWSTYLDLSSNNTPLNATFHPDAVTSSKDTAFALRVQVSDTSYENSVKQFDSAVKKGSVTSAPYTPKLVTSVLGLKLSGEIATGKTGVMVLLPLRDKTIKIWTESTNYTSDLDKYVLETLSYQP